MKKIYPAILLAAFLLLSISSSKSLTGVLSNGEQPQLAVDAKGVIRVVFGRQDQVFCATSVDKGFTFSEPVLVATIPGMHLGMSRGPQLASSDGISVITAMDKTGNIHWFRLYGNSGNWQPMGMVNDLGKSAPEGLMGLAADHKNNFYAVWLDTRTGGRNQIYFSSLTARAGKWSKNILAYQSPDGHTCECCKPNIAVKNGEVVIMFRNWLNGSRDLYITKSINGGKTFAAAEKMGRDTWKLNGCPMDGGSISIDNSNAIETTWQRKGMVYFAEPGKAEIFIANGRNPGIAGTGADPLISLQNNDTVKLVSVKNKNVITVGNGGYLKSARLPGDKIFCVWEDNKTIRFRNF
ncbi:sialidase family protein [Mucilaginibacter sp. L3T2-6]|uniref:sialidase family protein n=1 Tax=Mucilaginibacter sp. L3T2-6 TaxID=3062491 RepID=UPI0026765FED|nr:sialidase family protein [Mucilaginibacter sp. L3T2-6]MDO3644186.1 sialidase family protein [Mucilaginibacter sp. L3T2-6]MDV6216717.1 sialidase family protein [Mucilaginibacter sp. L3T2-6]